MTSIDELFKKPFLPTSNGATKRKFETPDAQAAYKSAKLSDDPDVKQPHPEDGEDDDTEAGPSLPPEEEEEDDDEEGRFFGGGVTKDTSAAMDFVERAEDGTDYVAEKIDSTWLRRLGLSFEKNITKNSELRAKYENEPQKFVASEADLDAEIKRLSVLSQYPDLFREFAEIGCAASLVSLLAHENTDIAIDAIEIISELLDDDVQAEQEQWDALVDAMLDADLLGLLLSNLQRLDESVDADRSGVYHSLAVLEGLASNTDIIDRVAQEPVLKYLLDRIAIPETAVSQNKQYSAEVLQVLAQAASTVRDRLIALDAVDKILQLLANYRKRDPERDSTEEEYAEDLFDCLTCFLSSTPGKDAFLAAEGIELMLIMLKESKFSKPRALKILDHSLSGPSQALAEKFIEAAGLKPLFSTFMKNKDAAPTEHILGIFSALLRLLPGESSQRIRLLAKFVEKNYEKLEKLVKLRLDYAAKVAIADQSISTERRTLSLENAEDMREEWFSRRLDAGLFCLQTLDVVLAWLVAEDHGAKVKVVALLKDRDFGLEDLKMGLKEQIQGVDAGEEGNAAEMLAALVECL